MTLRKIVIATDFSEPALVALRAGASWARRFDAAVELVHVFDPAPPVTVGLLDASWPPLDLPRHEADCKAEMARLEEQWLGGVREVRHVVMPHPSAALAICDHAAAQAADLVVVGSHGRTGGERLLLGSVAEHVVRQAPCAVLCVRRSAAPEELSRRLVVCTDLSPAAMAAVELAGEVASKLGSAVNLVHVCDGAKHWRRRDGAPIDVERDLGAALARIYAEALPRGAEIAVLRGGSVVDMLTGHAVAMGADLMVLATHGRTGVRRLFVGSVAERVTRHAPCSVLVARAAFAP